MAERRGIKALELWCRRMTEGYPGVKIDNMTTSWRDGLAFCAMIHHFRPDLIEFDKLNKADVYYNNELAFTTAEKYLGIPALLDAVDMAAHEVPDRLSILTYLSQFYQAFAAQDSPNRLKRPSPAGEKTQINKTAGPPPKMAHVVGVPRRDPCQKCQMPVFLAERLAVGKKIYHRTCLKCARCGSQLTPGSFYETEVDNEYCCETCPDEELDADAGASGSSNVLLRNDVAAINANADEKTTAIAAHGKATRSSIAERLAFFEHGSGGDADINATHTTATTPVLLQKSVTDEEKTQSLKRLEATSPSPTTAAAATSPYKMNSALSSFLSDAIDGDAESESSSHTADKSTTHMDTTESDDESSVADELSGGDAMPPALPTTPAPELEMPTPSKRFTATAQLQLTPTTAEKTFDEVVSTETVKFVEMPEATPAVRDAEDNLTQLMPEQPKKKTEIQMQLTTATTPKEVETHSIIDKTNNNGNAQEVEKAQENKIETETEREMETEAVIEEATEQTQTTASLEKRVELNATNDNDNCVTKENIAATIDTVTTAPADSIKEQNQIVQTSTISTANESVQNNEEPELDVELRTKSPNKSEKQEHGEKHGVDRETTERLSVVRARLQQFEVIANKNNINNDNDNINNNDNANANDSANVVPDSPEKHSLSDDINKSKQFSLSPTHEEQKIIPVEPKSMPQEKQEIEIESTVEMETDGEQATKSLNEVPLIVETKAESDKVIIVNEKLDMPTIEEEISVKPSSPIETIPEVQDEEDELSATSEIKSPNKVKIDEYPEDLNPFKSDEEDETTGINKENVTPRPRALNTTATSTPKKTDKLESSNPFDSSDDEIELEKSQHSSAATTPSGRVPPPRPPPPRISRNPFGDEPDEESDTNFSRRSSCSSSLTKKTPVPTPRTNVSQSQNPTPEPTPRLSTKTPQNVLQDSSDYYGSANSLSATPGVSLQRNSDLRGSNNSLTSSGGGTIRSRKHRKAPAPPPPVKELFPSSETVSSGSKASTPSSSTVGTPKMSRKKRPAPAPPKPARLDPGLVPQIALEHDINAAVSKNSLNYPLQSELDSKLSDEEKALLEGKQLPDTSGCRQYEIPLDHRSSRRIIPLSAGLLEDHDIDEETNPYDADVDDGTGKSDDIKQQRQHSRLLSGPEEETNVVYRRVVMPLALDTPTHDSNSLMDDLYEAGHDRQLEKLKDNKEANNRNRQSQISGTSSGAEDNDLNALYNKSAHGKWKRRKGPAPALPIPPRKVLQMLPLQEIRHELEIIEVQQQGLEKQGVILEKMIRDRCEGENGEPLSGVSSTGSGVTGDNENPGDNSKATTAAENVQNSKEVEDLILQLFELVNEKNELFRRQAELMYLRRQHRLEQEQADLEYEIRVLMAQPERNKTDSDKAREEALIARMVEVVQLRNEVIECLEMDRLREAEEDLSIKQRLELHTAKREGVEVDDKKALAKLSKKEKKKQKEAKKLSKSKKIDVDKDADESELNVDKLKLKKKKKKFLF